LAKHHKSRQWLAEHHSDSYVKMAQEAGYRSRAAYKLLEINTRDQIFHPGMTVIDLGAAPGGWSQVATKLVGHQGRVLALDILPMSPLAGVEFIQGDFRDQAIYEKILLAVKNKPIDLVISDMAPNISGIRAVDQPRSMYLVELAIELADAVVCTGGDLLIKVFQGTGFQELVKGLRLKYSKVVVRKPKASRSRSREVYLLARGFQGAKQQP